MRTAALLISLLVLASCVPLAEHPAGDEEHAMFDARLQGIWRAVGGDAPFLAFIGPGDAAKGGVHIVAVEETRDRGWKVDEYDGISARRGARGFLSIRYATSGGERRGWVIARYALTGRDRLTVALLDEKRLAPLVRAGTIAGRVDGDGPYADVDLTGGSTEILALLESKDGARLFGPPHTLVRASR